MIELQAEYTVEEWIQDLLNGKRGNFNRLVERDAGKANFKANVTDIKKLLKEDRNKRKKMRKLAEAA